MEQRRRIVRFARRNGFYVRHTVCEVLEHAPADFFARPGVQELLGFVTWRQRLFGKPCYSPRVFLVESRSRFNASEVDLALMFLHLSRRGISLFEVVSGQELTGDIAALERTVGKADFREFQSVRRRLRTAKWRATKKRRGKRCGPKPFGETPEEQQVLEEIWRLRMKPWKRPRRSYREIAAILNEKGMPTRLGRPWQAKTIQVIIQRDSPWLHDRNQAMPYWRMDFPRRR
jgi:DNA invertase Pin-like site-specific DNA recombinase